MSSPKRGFLYAATAFLIWGLGPLYWKLVIHVPPGQLLAHRVVWCAALLALLLTAQRRWAEFRRIAGSRRVMATLAASTLIIATNFLVYIWAVANEQVLQASLGYYINPLVSVLLGLVFLGERLNRAQWISIVLATAAVLILLWRLGELPWIALVLAFSFGFYGLLRKQVAAGPEVGLLFETLLMSPIFLLYLARADLIGVGAFGRSGIGMDLLLAASGLITAVPMVLFTHGARQLPLSTVGFLQYSAPTLQFLLAVFVFGEPFGAIHFAAFALIWIALTVFTWDAHRQWRKAPPPNPLA